MWLATPPSTPRAFEILFGTADCDRAIDYMRQLIDATEAHRGDLYRISTQISHCYRLFLPLWLSGAIRAGPPLSRLPDDRVRSSRHLVSMLDRYRLLSVLGGLQQKVFTGRLKRFAPQVEAITDGLVWNDCAEINSELMKMIGHHPRVVRGVPPWGPLEWRCQHLEVGIRWLLGIQSEIERMKVAQVMKRSALLIVAGFFAGYLASRITAPDH